MGTNEENCEKLWAMRQENEAALERREQREREAEYLNDMSARREWTLPTPEPPPPQRKRDTPAVNWSAEIDRRIGAERRFMIEVVGQAVGELREQIEANVRKEFQDELRQARVDAADAKIRFAELRISFTELREQLAGHVTDLPALPLRSHRAN